MSTINKRRQPRGEAFRGFTLIELLVTLSIIVLLSAISLVALQGSRQSGRDARRKSDLESIRSALELYKSDCGDYPASLSFGSTLVGDGTPASCRASNVYMAQIPRDPQHPTRTYTYTSTGSTYTLCASLEGLSGTCNYTVTNP